MSCHVDLNCLPCKAEPQLSVAKVITDPSKSNLPARAEGCLDLAGVPRPGQEVGFRVQSACWIIANMEGYMSKYWNYCVASAAVDPREIHLSVDLVVASGCQ